MGRIREKWNQIFFSEEPEWRWSLFLALFSLITIHYIINKGLKTVESNPYYSLPLFEFFRIPSPFAARDFLSESFGLSLSSRAFFKIMGLMVCGFLAMSALGLIFRRFFVALSLVSFFLYQGWLHGFIRTKDDPYVYHSANIIFFALLVWLAAPRPFARGAFSFWLKKIIAKSVMSLKFPRRFKSRRFFAPPPSLSRQYPVWPRLLIILTIAITYFSSFYCKLIESGFSWINGHTLQAFLLTASVIHPLSWGYWLASQNFYLIWALNIGVWVFQSTAPLGFLFRRTRLLYAAAGICFHQGTLLFMGVEFIPFQYYYAVFLPELFEFLQKLSLRLKAPLRKALGLFFSSPAAIFGKKIDRLRLRQ